MSWINDEFQTLDQSPRALRRFGLMVGLVILVLGLGMIWRHRVAGWPLSFVGAILIVMGILAPAVLKWIHSCWMMIAFLLGWIVTRILLTIAFFFVVTPVGLLQRIFKKRAIEVGFRADNVPSYWQIRNERFTPEDYEKQF